VYFLVSGKETERKKGVNHWKENNNKMRKQVLFFIFIFKLYRLRWRTK